MITIVEVKENEQIEACRGLACEIWRDYYFPIIGQRQTEYMLAHLQSADAITGQIAQEGYLYFLVYAGKKLIGYFALLPRKSSMFLSKIYVHSSVRGKGYGREILEDIIRRTKEKGFNKITLTVNKNNADAIRFYVKNGFTNHGSIVQGIGEGYVMDDYMFILNI